MNKRALLAHLTPYKSAMKFLSHCQPSAEAMEAARADLKGDIERALSDVFEVIGVSRFD